MTRTDVPAVVRRRQVVRVVMGAALSAAALLAPACGSGGGEEPPPATPGANVDPGADGVVGGSINKAKGVAEDSEERDAQLEQQGDG